MARKREPAGSPRTSRHCARCATYWPATVDYTTCPVCRIDTYGVIGKEPIPRGEAQSRAKQAEFDHFYVAHCARRSAAGEPTPEEKGAEEARVLIELEKRATAPDEEAAGACGA